MQAENTDGLIVYPHKRAGKQESLIIGFVVFPAAIERVFTTERQEIFDQLFPSDEKLGVYFGTQHDRLTGLGFLRRRITASTHTGVRRAVWLLREQLKGAGVRIGTEICLIQPKAVEQALGLRIRTPQVHQ